MFCTSHDDIFCETYKEACVKKGLLADDAEWVKCLNEAASFKMPKALRFLFATILTHCEPSEPFKLWIQFKLDLCEDFLYKRIKDKQKSIYLMKIHLYLKLRISLIKTI